MAFDKYTQVAKTLKGIDVILKYRIDEDGNNSKEGDINVMLNDETGKLVVVSAKLQDHITAGQLSGLIDLMDGLKTKAENLLT